MELLGKWTGVCYFEHVRCFVADSTMKLEIIVAGEGGTLGGKVTEICSLPGSADQENVFYLKGTFDEATGMLSFMGEGENQNRKMTHCVLSLRVTNDGDKMEGVFKDPNRKEDIQRVELYKGEVRRDLEESKARGMEFLRKIQKIQKIQEMEGRKS